MYAYEDVLDFVLYIIISIEKKNADKTLSSSTLIQRCRSFSVIVDMFMSENVDMIDA